MDTVAQLVSSRFLINPVSLMKNGGAGGPHSPHSVMCFQTKVVKFWKAVACWFGVPTLLSVMAADVPLREPRALETHTLGIITTTTTTFQKLRAFVTDLWYAGGYGTTGHMAWRQVTTSVLVVYQTSHEGTCQTLEASRRSEWKQSELTGVLLN